MLPKTKLGRAMFSKLKVHEGPCPEHGYKAQKAEVLDLTK
jgi:ribosomal protein L13